MRSWCAIALLPVLSLAIGRAQEWQIRGSQVADPPGSILAIEGTPQSAQVGTPFPLQFKVFVRDSLGNPWPFVTVRWTPPLTGPSGTFVGGVYTALTNANGVAVSAGFNANLVAGSYVVRATAAGISDPANFHLTNTAGPPATIIAVAGTPQSTMVNTYFSVRFSVLVRDAAGNPVPSLPVMWQAPATGASGTFDTSEVQGTTHDSGIVTAPPFRANGIAGSYVVTAHAAGIAVPAEFQLANTNASLSVEKENVRDHYELFQNYPNPFNPSTTIRFDVGEVRGQKSDVRRVTLKVYDLLGREVATLVNEEMGPGSYERVFDAKGLASGVYLYRLQAATFVETRKLLLVR